MFRPTFLRALQPISRGLVTRTALQSRCLSSSCIAIQSRQRLCPARLNAFRYYSAPAGLNKPEVEGRIIDLLKNFDKVKDSTKLTPAAHFANDLGLDSLDTVEVVMAIEEEFSIEIPDKEADAILSIDKAVEYILGQPDAH